MNNSIIEIALGTKFNPEQIAGVLELINATPNAQVALEVILGVYVEPVVPNTPEDMSRFPSNYRNIKFISYDKYTNQVEYSYNTMLLTKGWIEIGLDIDRANIVSNRDWSNDAAKELGIPQDDFTSKFKCHSFENGLKQDLNDKDVVGFSSCELHIWLAKPQERRK